MRFSSECCLLNTFKFVVCVVKLLPSTLEIFVYIVCVIIISDSIYGPRCENAAFDLPLLKLVPAARQVLFAV
jgi:hypothetical protein